MNEQASTNGDCMNAASAWRVQFARYVADAYAAEPAVAAVLVGGSAARGHADQYSDVEVGVFWDAPPSEEQRQRVMGRVVADGKRAFAFDAAEEVWCEDYFIGRAESGAERSGLLVEIAGHTVEHVNRTFDQVLLEADPDPLKQNLIAGVAQGIAIKGHDLLDSWRERSRTYPDSLARAVVLRHAQIDHYWRRRMWLARQNRLMFDQQMCDVGQRVLHMLLAVNRIYYFGFKWQPLVLSQLACAPRDFASRFAAVGECEPDAAAEGLRQLVEETYDLVELHVPGVPVDRLRSIFRWQRPVWGDEPPPIHPPSQAEQFG
jgi:hypothetical protein